MRSASYFASRKKWKSTRMRCSAAIPLNRKTVKLKSRRKRPRLKLLARRSSKNLRVRKRNVVLRLSISKTYVTNFTCKSLKSKLVFVNVKKLKNVRR
jgi:hypothetical protein